MIIIGILIGMIVLHCALPGVLCDMWVWMRAKFEGGVALAGRRVYDMRIDMERYNTAMAVQWAMVACEHRYRVVMCCIL